MIPVAAIALTLVVVAAVVTTLSLLRVRQVNRRFQILDDIAHVVDAGGDLEETLNAITEILVPELCDVCAIDLVEGPAFRRVAVRVSGPDAAETEAKLAARPPALQAQMASEAGDGRVEPRLFEHVDEEVLRDAAADEEDFRFLRSLGTRSSVIVELRARGRIT
ncbi:MAG TPA: hypothetical protein VGV34_07255, partial [Solirubrobacterales bacterium]|nr:hypothetical protein [Solirubrobacterales bacterium]